MAPSPEKQAGKLLGLLAEEGRQYGDLVAERLVELVRSEPLESRDDLHRQLVTGAASYLSHTAWYARVAAASCLESLARLEYVREETLPGGNEEGSCGGDALTDELARGWVGLGDVRLAEVLERGALLLSYGEDGDSIRSEPMTPYVDVGIRVGRQRKRLLKCLGLAGGSGEARAGSLYSSIGDAIEDEDLQGPAASTKTYPTGGGGSSKSDDPIASGSGSTAQADSGSGNDARQQLSARQRNRLAREARSSASAAAGKPHVGGGGKGTRRRSTVGGDCGDGKGCGVGGKGGREDGPPAFLGRGPRAGMMDDVASNAREALVSLAADLVAQLFHPIWQCRHGAALGALSILRAWNARRRRGEPVPYGDRMAAWAEDAVARCVCVLALDRFGDYSGRMVAPVRETAAQLFAVAALQLDADRFRQAAGLLFELTASKEWQARHGGFCGLDSLCAVAITGDGADGKGAPREASVFLHDLVYRAAPRGLSDPAEDVCAAAARAIRLVIRRFLPSVEAGRGRYNGNRSLPTDRSRRGREPPEVGNETEAEGEGGATGTVCGGGGEVFDLVWKALGHLDRDSTCVEDLADLLETCCEDIGRSCGAFFSSGEERLTRLVDLWEDGRAGVRACSVRSLLALARGVVRATPLGPKTHPVESAEAAAEPVATAAASAARRCESLLFRCFQALSSEQDDSVREHSARLWSELLKGLGRTDDRHEAAHASLMTSCLAFLFGPPAPALPLPTTTALEEGATAGGAAIDSAVSFSPSSASTKADRRASKRARKETTSGRPNPGKLATALAASSSAGPDSEQHPQHQQQRGGEDMEIEERSVATAGAGASASFFGRLASARALAELARAETAAHDEGESSEGAAASVKAGSRRRRDSSGKRPRPPATPDWHGRAADDEAAAATTARELIMSEVARRAESGWAWEQELAFFLMEASCGDGGGGSGGAPGGGGRGPASARDDEILSKAEQDAWRAVDHALATKDDAAAADQKLYRELEAVDKAVSATCRGVIGVLVQAADPDTDTTGTTKQPTNAPSSNVGVTTAPSTTAAASAACGRKATNAATRKPPRRGKGESRGTVKAAAAAPASAAIPGSPSRSRPAEQPSLAAGRPPPQGAASVERMFQSLAAAFGETLVPLDRGATLQVREAVWTERLGHFHARIQAQQAIHTRRVTSAAAAVYAVTRPLPLELNPILRPIVSAVKNEPDVQRRGRCAARLAHLAAALLGDAARSERRDAGAMVLFVLASLSGRGQQQNLSLAAAAAPRLTEEALTAMDVTRDGATETLRHAMALASSSTWSSSASLQMSMTPVPTLRPSLSTRSSRGGEGGSGSGGDRSEEEELVEGRGGGGGGGQAVGDWALQTLAPLLQHPLGKETTSCNPKGAGTAMLPRTQRKLSAAEHNKSAAEIRAIDLSAALGVADALLQAARDPPRVISDAHRGVGGARPLLASLLLETPLAAGLFALAQTGCVAVSAEDDTNTPTEPTHLSIPLPHQQQRSGGGASASLPATQSIDDGAHAATTVAAATADAALVVLRDAAALFPEGLWEGLRAELLPALASEAGSCSGTGGGGRGGNGVRGGRLGGNSGVGMAPGVRAGLVLKEVVGGMGTGVVPFAARLLPVALRGMTDADEKVRGLLAGTFNDLVKAVALVADDGDDGGHARENEGRKAAGGDCISTELAADPRSHGQAPGSAAVVGGGKPTGDSVEEDGELIARHLVRGEPLPRLHRGLLPETLRRKAAAGVTIRPYQWEGIAWLDFLRRIGAHGILADDMGLGKTLQALMAVAMCHHHHYPGRRSLVVCPSMLVYHWKAECLRYFGDGLLRPVAYAGPAKSRRHLAGQLGLGPTDGANNNDDDDDNNYNSNSSGAAGSEGRGEGAAAEEEEPGRANVVITSYNVLRMDADVLGKQGWLYLVLDEAHLLRNPATRTAKAARALRSNHRVGLTGTPIQNSVMELWSLFQFLMPGYLGDRRSFQRDVARPVRAALSSDGDGRATVEGLQELEKLHRQVLPFVLRREKSEVLADLPPKIITEMVCDLTPEQRRLHNIWERGGAGGRLTAAIAHAEEMEAARLRAAAAAAAAAAVATSECPPGNPASIDAAAASSTTASMPSPNPTATREGAAARVASAAGDASTKLNTTTTIPTTGRLPVGAQTLGCLTKLQLLCVHPSLVASEEEPKRWEMSKDARLSGKLMALKELLRDAGIGGRQTSKSGGGGESSSSGSDSDSGDSIDGDKDTMDESSSSDNDEQDAEEQGVGREVGDGTSGASLEQNQNGRLGKHGRERGRNSFGNPKRREGTPLGTGIRNITTAATKGNPNSHRGSNSNGTVGHKDAKGASIGSPGSARAASSSSSRTAAGAKGAVGENPSPCVERSLPQQEEVATAAEASLLPGCKCLIFAQHKAALDVTESALLLPCFPGVNYLRVDGSMSQACRAAAVDRFSADPSVAILLLTTRVGHLGLNLSAASMVVFLEHDWNPQVDLQAMDRAHRLGQKKAVNVYRLIAADSIEERILRLQGHKLEVAGAVVRSENASAFSSGTGGVLGMLGEAMAVVAAGNKTKETRDGGGDGIDNDGGGESLELWSADEDYAYLAAERLTDSVARE